MNEAWSCEAVVLVALVAHCRAFYPDFRFTMRLPSLISRFCCWSCCWRCVAKLDVRAAVGVPIPVPIV